MARWEFKLPDIGEGITEGEVVSWHVKAGDAVREDQPIVEVMTDKATVTITAPKAGIVVETHGRVGEIVAVHSTLVVFDLDDAAVGASHANGSTPPAHERSATAVGEIRDHLPGIGPSVGGGAEARYFNDKPLATPATRKLARDKNVDLRRIPPTGPQGRVTKGDVESFVGRPGAPPPVPRITETNAAPFVPDGAPSADERVPLAGLRRKIAQKMALATSRAAHFTFVEECDATALKALRDHLKDEAQREGAKLTFLPFVVKAVVAALKRHPLLNTVFDDEAQEIVFRKRYNIGIATATEAGLVVPVVKDADKKGLLAIAREIDRVAGDVRGGKSKLEDLQGSTFTITSLGARSGLMATPIVNYPEVAILGVHRMKERPVVRDGSIVVGNVMLLSLSFDHRVVDGHVGAAFAYDVIGYLEQPERLLLEMA